MTFQIVIHSYFDIFYTERPKFETILILIFNFGIIDEIESQLNIFLIIFLVNVLSIIFLIVSIRQFLKTYHISYSVMLFIRIFLWLHLHLFDFPDILYINSFIGLLFNPSEFSFIVLSLYRDFFILLYAYLLFNCFGFYLADTFPSWNKNCHMAISTIYSFIYFHFNSSCFSCSFKSY